MRRWRKNINDLSGFNEIIITKKSRKTKTKKKKQCANVSHINRLQSPCCRAPWVTGGYGFVSGCKRWMMVASRFVVLDCYLHESTTTCTKSLSHSAEIGVLL